ncbi:hypothetical protein NOCARDAX2BIS_430018 [Nocardioides sp. AX2bis]|nr:hypothetical protein NOCARDAX2BIS_430018 [Nocardioides sp. AX2bis]
MTRRDRLADPPAHESDAAEEVVHIGVPREPDEVVALADDVVVPLGVGYLKGPVLAAHNNLLLPAPDRTGAGLLKCLPHALLLCLSLTLLRLLAWIHADCAPDLPIAQLSWFFLFVGRGAPAEKQRSDYRNRSGPAGERHSMSMPRNLCRLRCHASHHEGSLGALEHVL